MKPGSTLIRRLRQARYLDKVAHVPPDEGPHPVLDMGCGRFPVPGADFAADHEPCGFDSPEMREKLEGRFVKCDIHDLPFADQAFGFVHCSNVLEHVGDPGRAFAELERVGRHGFAESPTGFRERWVTHPDAHRWIIRWQNGEIAAVQPTQLRIAGVQVLPPPFTQWIKRNFRLPWKCFMYAMDQVLDIAFNKVRW